MYAPGVAAGPCCPWAARRAWIAVCGVTWPVCAGDGCRTLHALPVRAGLDSGERGLVVGVARRGRPAARFSALVGLQLIVPDALPAVAYGTRPTAFLSTATATPIQAARFSTSTGQY